MHGTERKPHPTEGGASARQAEHLPGSFRVAAIPARVTGDMMAM